MLDAVKASTPVVRIGISKEFADAIVFLYSDATRIIHGQVVELDGGFLMA